MKITLDYTRNAFENASIYFDKAKKAKNRIAGAQEVLLAHKKKLDKLRTQKEKFLVELSKKKPPRAKEWFEKFRWCITPSGLLAIGGRDATTNEIVIKKHTLDDSYVFHTEMAGSPFFVIQPGEKQPTEQDIRFAAQMTGVFSRAWQNNFASVPVFMVRGSQVSKTPNSGEFVAKGAFIVRGKKEQFTSTMELALAKDAQERIVAGTVEQFVLAKLPYVKITQGTVKPSDAAKVIAKVLGHDDLDEIIRVLPAGGIKIHQKK